MGIPGLERLVWNIKGCVIEVSIEDLVKKYKKNTIVVDGFQFYAQYVYPKFDWVCGAFKDLVRVVHDFVQAFQRIGVKLVFFFVDGNLDEGADSCGSTSWMRRHSEFVEYSKKVISVLSKSQFLNKLKEERGYYHTPLNALSVVLFALRDILHCEVHFVDSGDRCDATSYYCKNDDCVALLAQDNFYIFYRSVPRYLSLKNLKLRGMTTVQYSPEALARHLNLEGLLLPCLVPDASSITSDQKELLMKINEKLDESENASVARKKIMQLLSKNKKIEEVLNLGDIDVIETLRPDVAAKFFCVELLRYKYEFDYLKVEGPLKKWDLIELRSQEMYESGEMSSRIQQILMSKKYYNECILEDFVDFPPSSVIYEPLRKMLYGVLFQEETDFERDGSVKVEGPCDKSIESTEVEPRAGPLTVWEKKLHEIFPHEKPQCKGVQEWFMTKEGCLKKAELTNPQCIDSTLHPGLLLLWDLKNETHAIRDKKWQLFTSCISDRLSWQHLQTLPPTLVVPAVVLHYLFQVVPKEFRSKSWKYLEPWEVEVFLAQCVMLPKISDESFSKITISRINARVVKLMAIFLCGCRTVRLLVEACGYPISEINLCPLQFFDGKLFHSFYDRAEWRRSAMGLCKSEALPEFEQLKQVVYS